MINTRTPRRSILAPMLPALRAALVRERLLTEVDGAMSAIRSYAHAIESLE
jgi:hypothetical protein